MCGSVSPSQAYCENYAYANVYEVAELTSTDMYFTDVDAHLGGLIRNGGRSHPDCEELQWVEISRQLTSRSRLPPKRPVAD